MEQVSLITVSYTHLDVYKRQIQTNRLVLEITEERMRKYERAASEKGMPRRQWLTELADEAADVRQLRTEQSSFIRCV